MATKEEIMDRMREDALLAVDSLAGHEEAAKFIGDWILANKQKAGWKNLAKALAGVADGTVQIPTKK